MQKHATLMGAQIIQDHIERVELAATFKLFSHENQYSCNSLIIATEPVQDIWVCHLKKHSWAEAYQLVRLVTAFFTETFRCGSWWWEYRDH